MLIFKVNNLILAFFLMAFSLLSISLHAMYPYELDFRKDLSIFAKTGAVSFYLQNYKRTDSSSVARLNSLDPNDLPYMDRHYANGDAVSGMSELSDHWQYFGVASAYLSSVTDGTDWWKTAFLYLQADYLSSTSASLFQRFSTFYAPYAYDSSVADETRQDVTAKMTFLSMHISRTSTAFFFMAKVYSDKNPFSKWVPFAYTAATMGALIGGFSRVEARLHFPSDALAGIIWGGFIGWYIPHIHSFDYRYSIVPVVNKNYAGFSYNLRF